MRCVLREQSLIAKVFCCLSFIHFIMLLSQTIAGVGGLKFLYKAGVLACFDLTKEQMTPSDVVLLPTSRRVSELQRQ